jgi:hypothetical protein
MRKPQGVFVLQKALRVTLSLATAVLLAAVVTYLLNRLGY